MPASSFSSASVFLGDVQPAFFQPAFGPGTLFEGLDELGQQQADQLVAGQLGRLDHERLDGLADDAACRPVAPDDDLKPRLRRAARAARPRLDRPMERQGAARMTYREQGDLIGFDVHAEVDRTGHAGSAATHRRRVEHGLIGHARIFGQVLGGQALQSTGNGGTAARGGPHAPSWGVDLHRHEGLGSRLLQQLSQLRFHGLAPDVVALRLRVQVVRPERVGQEVAACRRETSRRCP